MRQSLVRMLVTQLLCVSFFLPSVMPITLRAEPLDQKSKLLPAVAQLAAEYEQTRAPRDPLLPDQPLVPPQSLIPTFGSLTIPQDLTVGGTTTVDNIVINGTITAPGGFNIGDLLILTDGSGGQSCIVFRQPDLFEKGRICSSPVHNVPGIRMSVDGGVTQNLQIHNGGTVEVANNLQVDQTAYVQDLSVANSATVGGLTNLQATNIYGHLNVTQTKFFTRGTPGVAQNILLVTKGDLTGPDTFNSVKAAVDSITDSSITKPYAVVVGPGVFDESEPIVLKEYVSLIGQSQEATILRVTDPSKDVIHGCDESYVANLKMEGATATGSAGARFTTGGKFELNQVEFGSNDTCMYVDTTGGAATVIWGSVIIEASAEFATGVKMVGAGADIAAMKISNFTWVAETNSKFGKVFDISGPNARFVGSGIDVGSPTFFGGVGFEATNGASINMQASSFHGFDTGIWAPPIGAGPSLSLVGVAGRGNVMDVNVTHTAATGTINGVFAREKTHIEPTSVISLFLTDPEDQGTVTMGPVYMGDTMPTITDMSPVFEYGLPLGAMDGGALSSGGGYVVNIAAGSGYLMYGNHLVYITWDPASINLGTLPTPQTNSDNYFYVYYDGNPLYKGTVATTIGEPNPLMTIDLGKARTGGGAVVFLQEQDRQSYRPVTNMDSLLRNGFGAIYEAGSLVSKSGDLGLNVSEGEYYFGTHEYLPSGASPLAGWSAWYHSGPGVFTVAPQVLVDYQQYDNGTGLTAITPTWYARHAFYVVGDGATERYELVYAQDQHAAPIDAGTLPVPPGTWNGNIALIASILVQNTGVPGTGIVEIRDERPRLAFKASSVSGVTVHDDLTGRNLNANHPQYLTIDGSRAMAANLPMGGNSITGVNQVNGVVVENHHARHGANSVLDPLDTAAPVDIGTANAIGSANEFSRADHVHNHGNLPGGALHAVATTAVAGFMSAADKTKLNGLNSADYLHLTGGTMTGSLVLSGGSTNLTVGGTTTLALGLGVVHSSGAGLLTSLQIVDADINPTSSTYIGAAAANAATSANTPNTIVKRDGFGDFSAGTITANLVGNATTATTATNFTGALAGDVTGTQAATVVGSVGGQSATNVAAGTVLANNATNVNTASQIVRRDGSGNFSAGNITANLLGNATTATSAGSFSGSLAGDVTGTQSATVVSFVGGQTAANVAAGTVLANAATNLNTANQIVKRDGSGNFSAGNITANLLGNATTSTSFTGSLAGDVTGTQGATTVALVGGQTAANVAAGTVLANSATNLNTANQIVKRDASGNFSAGTITANLNGNATTATSAGSFSGSLAGDVTGTQSATVVATVGGQTAANVAAGTVLANNATAANTASQIVRRDASGNFVAGTITANLLGNATTANSFTGLLVGDVTGTQGATVVSFVGGQTAVQVAAGVVLANSATNLNTANQIVKRDSSGNFLAGTINGVTVQTHAARHLPISGADPLTTAAPVTIGTSNAIGSADSFSRSDHVHAHGAQTDGTLHAVATTSVNGFMSAADKLKLNGLNAGDYVLKAGDTMTGSLVLSGGTTNLTVGGVTTLNGNLLANSGYTFAQGVPGIPVQILQVTKGTLHGPNQFNSVKAAVDSITDSSITKPYAVVVGAGVFEESETIVLKEYVSLIGQSQEATILRITDPSKDVIHGWDEAYVANLKMEGATATGSAGARFTTGGKFELNQVEFGSNDTCMYVDATGGDATVIWGSAIIEADAEFVTGIKVISAGGNAANMKLSNFTWLADTNSIFNTVIDVSGSDTTFVGSGIDVGSPTLFGGIGFKVTDGAAINLQCCSFHGFATAISVPAVGAGPSLSLTSVAGRGNTADVNIANLATTGTINGVFARSKLSINPAATISLFVTDPEAQGTVTVGPQYVGEDVSVITDISPEIEQGSNMGVIYGGDITPGVGLTASVSAGTGYLMVGTYPNDNLKYVTWLTNAAVALTANADNFIFVDNAGVIAASTSSQPPLTTILIGKARTNATAVVFTEHMHQEADHAATLLDNSWRGAFGPIYASGSIVTKNGTLQLDAGTGLYYYGTHEYRPGGGSAISWHAFYRNGSGNYTIVSQNNVDYQRYDNGSGTLATIPLGQYAKHELFVVNGPSEQYLLVYGQQVFATLNDANNGDLPNPPGSWTGNISPLFAIVVQNTATPANQISNLISVRPLLGFHAGSVAGVTNHGDLTGLLADDHPQYVLTNGGRLMTGSLQIGGGNAVQLYDSSSTFTSSIKAGALTASTLPLVLPTTNGAANTVLTNDGAANLSWSSIAGAGAFVDGGNTGLTSPAVLGNNDANDLNIVTNGVNRLTISSAGAIAIPAFGTAGVVHNNGTGVLSSLLVANGDLATVSSANNNNYIVVRDPSGDFAAGTITASLNGNATTATTATNATNFTGPLLGDVTGIQGATVVSLVGGQSAFNVAAGTLLANNATNLNTVNQIVRRDASGSFSAGNITANLLGNATTATSFTGSLVGDVTGTQGATVVSLVGGQTAANVAAGTVLANNATAANTINQIVRRDGTGNFSAGNITANLLGNATTATSAASFTGSLAGDVTGTQGATVVASVGGQSAVNVAAGTLLANNATNLNTVNQIVRRDASGSFSAGTITANLLGNATTATTATNFSGSLAGDVTGTQGATVVALVGGQTAANVAAGTVLANNATNLNTASQIVRRDASGNFSAGNITANLLGNATTATSFTGSLVGDVTGTQGATVVSLVGGQTAASVAAGTVLANNATAANTINQIVRRDGTGNFSAGNITANLLGNATTATTAVSFSGSLAGDVTGTQGATTVALVGGQTAANVAAGTVLANNATAANTANQIVKRDALGNFVAGTITANLNGNATTATTATSFSGPLLGDVTGTQGATVVSLVGGQTAANVAAGTVLANNATSANTASQIVRRDASGNFSAGTITASLTGAASLNVLKAGDTMTGALLMGNQNQLRLGDTGVNYVAMRAPTTLPSSYTLTYPTTAGASGQVLSTDGAGNLSWIANGGGGGTVYYVSAYVGSGLTLPSNSTVTVPFSVEVLDSNNNFNPATYTYTAPLTGIYWVGVNLTVINSSNYARRVEIYKNGSALTGYSIVWSTSNNPISLMGVVSLAAGNTLTVRYTGRAADLIQATDTSINIYKIG